MGHTPFFSVLGIASISLFVKAEKAELMKACGTYLESEGRGIDWRTLAEVYDRIKATEDKT